LKGWKEEGEEEEGGEEEEEKEEPPRPKSLLQAMMDQSALKAAQGVKKKIQEKNAARPFSVDDEGNYTKYLAKYSWLTQQSGKLECSFCRQVPSSRRPKDSIASGTDQIRSDKLANHADNPLHLQNVKEYASGKKQA
jgi:hypothetical protein